tara:strand:- start:222 stop:437 length:216 start_codon:yes stop_codon:yes gene_type:complete
MVRKILDGMSIASFTLSLTILLGGGYLYMNRTSYINNALLTMQDQIIDIIKSQIQIPSIPNTTGPTLPFNR